MNIALAVLLGFITMHAPPRGVLIIVGGGGTPPSVIERAAALAGGKKARVAVLPQASRRPNAGESTVEMFKAAGVAHAAIVRLDKPKDAVKALESADLIWMPGGSQSRLMDALAAAPGVTDAMTRRYRAGAVIGGTSAGAAVMSRHMITGDADLESLKRGTTKLEKGLGLFDGFIVDQHFHARRRFNRLLGAVLDHQASVGVGIDEKTAIIVHGSGFEVAGASSVLVIDGRRASVRGGEKPLHAAAGVALHVLDAGCRYDLKTGSTLKQ